MIQEMIFAVGSRQAEFEIKFKGKILAMQSKIITSFLEKEWKHSKRLAKFFSIC